VRGRLGDVRVGRAGAQRATALAGTLHGGWRFSENGDGRPEEDVVAKKAKLPKRIAGFKVPKRVRKSKMVNGLLGNEFGRQIVADAIVAGAGAAAVVLVRERDEVADATVTGAKKGAHAFGLLAEAVESGVDAAIASVTDSVRRSLPEDKPKRRGHRGKAAGRGKAAAEAETRH